MLMALGQFVFGLNTLPFNDFHRQTAWKHRSTSRAGARDANQFLGPGDETINIGGVLAPEFTGDVGSLDDIRYMADTGGAYVLVDAAGYVYGAYVIDNMSETGTFYASNGLPRRIEFSISLKRVDDQLIAADEQGGA